MFALLPERQRENPFAAFAAQRRGCDTVLHDPSTPPPRDMACVVVPDAAQALGRVASVLHGDPSGRIPVFGIDGAARPRALVASALAALLDASGMPCTRLASGTIAGGGRVRPVEGGELDAVRLQEELARVVDSGGAACVLELGAGAVGEDRVGGVRFRRRLTAEAGVEADFSPVRLSPHGSLCVWRRDGREHRVTTTATGREQLWALGAALGLAADAGIPVSRLASALPTLRGLDGWLEPVRCGQRFGVFVDAARDADSLAVTLAVAREITQGRLIVVTGPRPGQGAGERRALAGVAGRADVVVATVDDATPREFALMSGDFGMEASGGGAVVVSEPDRARAVARAVRMARAGDVVVLAGKALDAVQRADGAWIPWDDRAHAREALAEIGYVGGGLC